MKELSKSEIERKIDQLIVLDPGFDRMFKVIMFNVDVETRIKKEIRKVFKSFSIAKGDKLNILSQELSSEIGKIYRKKLRDSNLRITEID